MLESSWIAEIIQSCLRATEGVVVKKLNQSSIWVNYQFLYYFVNEVISLFLNFESRFFQKLIKYLNACQAFMK
jgi:hypothetical protein